MKLFTLLVSTLFAVVIESDNSNVYKTISEADPRNNILTAKGALSLPNGWMKQTQQIMTKTAEDIYKWGIESFSDGTVNDEFPIEKMPENAQIELEQILNEMGDALDNLYKSEKV